MPCEKAKNSLLLSGIGCFAVYFLWSMVRCLIEMFTAQEENYVRFLMANQFYPALFLLLLTVPPVLLLVRNLKGKDGKVLPILSVVLYAFVLVLWLFSAVTPAIPQYLVYSKVGLVDTYFIHILKYLSGDGLLLFAGYNLTLAGSILFLIKTNKKVEETL